MTACLLLAVLLLALSHTTDANTPVVLLPSAQEAFLGAWTLASVRNCRRMEGLYECVLSQKPSVDLSPDPELTPEGVVLVHGLAALEAARAPASVLGIRSVEDDLLSEGRSAEKAEPAKEDDDDKKEDKKKEEKKSWEPDVMDKEETQALAEAIMAEAMIAGGRDAAGAASAGDEAVETKPAVKDPRDRLKKAKDTLDETKVERTLSLAEKIAEDVKRSATGQASASASAQAPASTYPDPRSASTMADSATLAPAAPETASDGIAETGEAAAGSGQSRGGANGPEDGADAVGPPDANEASKEDSDPDVTPGDVSIDDIAEIIADAAGGGDAAGDAPSDTEDAADGIGVDDDIADPADADDTAADGGDNDEEDEEEDTGDTADDGNVEDVDADADADNDAEDNADDDDADADAGIVDDDDADAEDNADDAEADDDDIVDNDDDDNADDADDADEDADAADAEEEMARVIMDEVVDVIKEKSGVGADTEEGELQTSVEDIADAYFKAITKVESQMTSKDSDSDEKEKKEEEGEDKSSDGDGDGEEEEVAEESAWDLEALQMQNEARKAEEAEEAEAEEAQRREEERKEAEAAAAAAAAKAREENLERRRQRDRDSMERYFEALESSSYSSIATDLRSELNMFPPADEKEAELEKEAASESAQMGGEGLSSAIIEAAMADPGGPLVTPLEAPREASAMALQTDHHFFEISSSLAERIHAIAGQGTDPITFDDGFRASAHELVPTFAVIGVRTSGEALNDLLTAADIDKNGQVSKAELVSEIWSQNIATVDGAAWSYRTAAGGE